jgi:hypothetical protein
VAGRPLGTPGWTNAVRVHVIGDAAAVGTGAEPDNGGVVSEAGDGEREAGNASCSRGRPAGWCPGWDSNPHCMVFETMDSACWSTGALAAGHR